MKTYKNKTISQLLQETMTIVENCQEATFCLDEIEERICKEKEIVEEKIADIEEEINDIYRDDDDDDKNTDEQEEKQTELEDQLEKLDDAESEVQSLRDEIAVYESISDGDLCEKLGDAGLINYN